MRNIERPKTMKLFIALPILFLFISCTNKIEDTLVQEPSETVSNIATEKTPSDVVLTFINAYVDNCNKMNKAVEIGEWVNTNQLVTSRFKIALKKLMDDAYKIDPEMGLDADPILDAQDYPEKGFELASINRKTNTVVVKGIDWPDFTLTIKVVDENGVWLVDACGMVNVLAD